MRLSAFRSFFRSRLTHVALFALAPIIGYIGFHSESALLWRLDSSSESVSCSAAEELSKKGPAARFALSKLEAMLSNRACVQFGEDDLPEYIEAVGGIDPFIRAMKSTPGFNNPKIAWWLRYNAHRYPQRIHDVVPLFIGGLHSQDQLVRHASAEGLGTLGPAAADAAPDLESALQDPDSDVRRSAAGSLGAVRSLDGLKLAVTNPDPQVRHIAIMRLGGMSGAEIADARAGYNETLNDPELSEVGRKKLQSLYPPPNVASQGGFGQAALPYLISALDDPDANNATAAADRLHNLGRAALPALESLENAALHGASPDLRSAALQALRSIGPAGKPAISQAMHDPDPNVSNYAIRLLASYGK